MISIFNQIWTPDQAYLKRTSGVPRSYHHLQTVEKTKGLHVPLAYRYSTSIFKLRPYSTLDKIKTTLYKYLSPLKCKSINSKCFSVPKHVLLQARTGDRPSSSLLLLAKTFCSDSIPPSPYVIRPTRPVWLTRNGRLTATK